MTPTVTRTVSPAPSSTPTPQVCSLPTLRDGDFPAIRDTAWVAYSEQGIDHTPLCDVPTCGNGGGTTGPLSDPVWVWFGGTRLAETATLSQTVAMPGGKINTILNFYLWIGSHSDIRDNGTLVVELNPTGSTETHPIMTFTNNDHDYDAGYRRVSINVSQFASTPGNYDLMFRQTNGASSHAINISMDDVSFTRFTDVLERDPISHIENPFYTPINYLNCQGVISGYEDNTFRPFADTTRGQLAKIVVLAENFAIIDPQQPTFSDVAAGSAFYSYVETAVARGIISGYQVGNTREFRPNNNVTRGQLSKIVVNAAGWTPINPSTPTFIDVNSANTFYESIETAASKGVISGYSVAGGKEFRWGNNATRGQIAKVIYQAINTAAK